MVTTRLRTAVVLLVVFATSALTVGCAKKDAEETTVADSTTTSSEAPGTTASRPTGRAECTAEALAKAAEATNPGATVTDLSCNSTGSRAVATVKDSGGCRDGCVGFFLAEGTTWSLKGTQAASAEFDEAAFKEWKTLSLSWKAKRDATSAPSRPTTTAGGSADAGDPVPEMPTTTLLPPDASDYCKYYGPIPRCVQDPKYDPNTTLPPPTEAPPAP